MITFKTAVQSIFYSEQGEIWNMKTIANGYTWLGSQCREVIVFIMWKKQGGGATLPIEQTLRTRPIELRPNCSFSHFIVSKFKYVDNNIRQSFTRWVSFCHTGWSRWVTCNRVTPNPKTCSIKGRLPYKWRDIFCQTIVAKSRAFYVSSYPACSSTSRWLGTRGMENWQPNNERFEVSFR